MSGINPKPISQAIAAKQAAFLKTAPQTYVDAIKNSGMWGSDLEIAAFMALNPDIGVSIHTPGQTTQRIGDGSPRKHTIHLLFSGKNHYDICNASGKEIFKIKKDGHCLFNALLAAQRQIKNQNFKQSTPNEIQTLRNALGDDLLNNNEAGILKLFESVFLSTGRDLEAVLKGLPKALRDAIIESHPEGATIKLAETQKPAASINAKTSPDPKNTGSGLASVDQEDNVNGRKPLNFKEIYEDLEKNKSRKIQSNSDKEATVSFKLKNSTDQGQYTISQGAGQNITFKPQIEWKFEKGKLSEKDKEIVDQMSKDALKYRSVFTTIKGPMGTKEEQEQQVKALSESLLAAAAEMKKDITLDNVQYTYDNTSNMMVLSTKQGPSKRKSPG